MTEPWRKRSELDDEDRSDDVVRVVPINTLMDVSESWNSLVQDLLKFQQNRIRDFWLETFTTLATGGLLVTLFAEDTPTMVIVWYVTLVMVWSGNIILMRRRRKDKKQREG